MKRRLTAVLMFLVCWIVGAAFGSYMGFIVGIAGAWLVLYLTNGASKTNRKWKWKNILGFNLRALIFWSIVVFHASLQLALWSAPITIHLLLFSLVVLHIGTIILFVMERPPKGPKQPKISVQKAKTKWFTID